MIVGRYLVDTTVFIDSARGRGSAPAWLEQAVGAGAELLLSAVSVAEYASGVEPGRTDRGLAFLSSLPVLPVTLPIAIRAGGLRYALARRGRALALADALIAATGLETGVSLVTSNVRDFQIDGLTVVQPLVPI